MTQPTEILASLAAMGAEWDQDRKVWLVPTEHRAELLALLAETGVNVEAS